MDTNPHDKSKVPNEDHQYDQNPNLKKAWVTLGYKQECVRF